VGFQVSKRKGSGLWKVKSFFGVQIVGLPIW
jgi:hypothetical protein